MWGKPSHKSPAVEPLCGPIRQSKPRSAPPRLNTPWQAIGWISCRGSKLKRRRGPRAPQGGCGPGAEAENAGARLKDGGGGGGERGLAKGANKAPKESTRPSYKTRSRLKEAGVAMSTPTHSPPLAWTPQSSA